LLVGQSRSHIPVLLREVLESLAPSPGETLADCTAGLGGHAAAIAPLLLPGGRIALNDLDAGNLEVAVPRVAQAAPGLEMASFQSNFIELPRRLERLGWTANMLLADLGFASSQVDDPSRGFSFQHDGPLDMRLDRGGAVSASDLVATLPEPELARILRDYGEERAARPIARKLVEARRRASIATTGQLAEIVRSVIGRTGSIDPATRTFQALRIAVNDELGSLEGLLAAVDRAGRRDGAGWLSADARVAIVSFHSLEDRLVKRAFQSLVGRGLAVHVGGHPTTAGEQEIADNPRARSAKLRVIRLVPGGADAQGAT
jgi:16S rRNA (cytosine1402-N4)-methyltransferase